MSRNSRFRKPGIETGKLHALEMPGSEGATLVLVDLQEEFLRALNDRSFLRHVLAQIALAKRLGWGIVLVETKPWRLGESIPEIQAALVGARFKRVSKQTTSGADKVLDACFEMGFAHRFFRVCGVYIDACIKGTAAGIGEIEPEASVRVMKEACASDLSEVEAWADFPEHERLVVSSTAVDNSSGAAKRRGKGRRSGTDLLSLNFQSSDRELQVATTPA